MTNQQKYQQLCEQNSEIPLFMQYWWLDAACKDQWNVLFCEEKGSITGVMVYRLEKKYGFKIITQPILTQYNGVWLFYPAKQKLEEKYSFENKVLNNLIKQLDDLKYDFFEQNLHFSQSTWQPFYWNAYKQTTRYTYVFESIDDLDAIYNSMSVKKRQKLIDKTSGKFKLNTDMGAKEFYDFYAQTLGSKAKTIDYSFDVFNSIFSAAKQKEQGRIFSLYDLDNNLHCSLFVVWDKHSAYNLVIAINPKYKSSGASTRIVYEAIKYLQGKTKSYDFEGSMIKGVALKNQSWGTKRIAYSCITKCNSKLYQLLKFLRQ